MKKLILGIMVLAMFSMVVFAVPNQLTYSGRLLQNGALVNSTLTMTFKIYDDPTSILATDLLWSTSNLTVPVNQGIYSVILDQVSPNVFINDNAYLEVVVGGETLSPRTRINSVGYALQAGGLSNGGVQAVTVSSNGFIGIGTTNPISQIHTVGTGRYTDESGAGAVLNGDPVAAQFMALTASNGSLTMNIKGRNIHFFTGTSFTEKITVDMNGNVGIGTTNPGNKLELMSDSAYTRKGRLIFKPGYLGSPEGGTDLYNWISSEYLYNTSFDLGLVGLLLVAPCPWS
jgi:hypothetical protein